MRRAHTCTKRLCPFMAMRRASLAPAAQGEAPAAQGEAPPSQGSRRPRMTAPKRPPRGFDPT